MKVAILARVSSEEQAGPLRNSIATQEQLLRGMASQRGWEVVRVFEIPGESAFADDIRGRPMFEAAINAACRREFDALLVSEFSRFSRHEAVTHEVLKKLRKAGCKLIGLNGTDYCEQYEMATIEGMMAFRSSRDQSFRVSNGHRGQFERGLLVGDIPFGYRRVMTEDARGAIVPNTKIPPVVVPEEADAIRWAFDHYLRSGSPTEIAIEFNRRGMRPRSKKGYTAFEPSSIQSLLENRAYAGWVTYKGEMREGLHEAIVSLETWAAVKARTERKERASRSARLLSGLLVCVWCKRHLTTENAANRYVERRRQNAPCPTHGKMIRAESAHEGIVEAVSALTWEGEGDWSKWVTARLRRPIADTTSERKELEEERRRVAKAYQLGALNDREFEAALRDIQARQSRLAPEVDSLRFAAERVQSFSHGFGAVSEAGKREILRVILERCEVDLATNRVWMRPRPEFAELAAARRDYVMASGSGTPDWNRTVAIHSDGFELVNGLYLPSELVAA